MYLKFKKKKGFSLVEMLITLVVVSVLLSAFVPVITKKMTKNIDITAGSSVPVGTIVAYLGHKNDIPDGWLLCDGSSFSESDYPKLKQHLKGTNLPNLKGLTLIGASDEDNTDANSQTQNWALRSQSGNMNTRGVQ